nr:uncharacterized protein LOC126516474 [Dermacentor andersoni]
MRAAEVRLVRANDDNDAVVYLRNRGEQQLSATDVRVLAAAGGGGGGGDDEDEDEGQVQTIRLIREQPARPSSRSIRVIDVRPHSPTGMFRTGRSRSTPRVRRR